jgi:hypothetical protein
MKTARSVLVSLLLAACSQSLPPVGASDTPTADEEKFWVDLAMAYESKLERCKTGWTGDGTLTVKDGKIVSLEIEEGGDAGTAVPELTGTAVPAIPASLQKEFEGPVSVSVCTGRARRAKP